MYTYTPSMYTYTPSMHVHIHTLEHFTEFKKKLHHLFPVIIDTKNICHGLRRV